MHTIFKDMLTAFFMGAVVPGMMLNVTAKMAPQPPMEPQETVQAAAPRPVYPMRERLEEDRVDVRNMDDYLLGVVLAEMPASFEAEALKAQAVAARTYTQKAYQSGGKHGDGSVCRDSTCCQAYIEPEAYLAHGGTMADLAKVRAAVEETCGQVLTYDGALIEATYFSCSGGRTEDAAAVWGTEFPYLQAVPSPGEENSVHFSEELTFTSSEFAEALGTELPDDVESWFGQTVYTDGGGVSTMEIGGTAYPGTRLRSLLGLRSTAFTVEAEGDAVKITTKGYGHRVGLSQYGADAMAVSGSTYEEILAHYYPGTVLSEIS